MDSVNNAVKEFIARNGGNKKVIAEKLGVITPQGLGRVERGERKASVKLIKAIKEKYGEDILENEPNVSRGNKKSPPDLERLVGAFESAVAAFTKALDSKDKQVQSLENDKNWLKSHIETLTVGFASLKQTQQ